MAAIAILATAASGCVSVAEFRKLERDVYTMKRGAGAGGERVADLRAELDAIDARLAKLEGRVDETQHTARRALEEAQHGQPGATATAETAPEANAEGAAPPSTDESTPPTEEQAAAPTPRTDTTPPHATTAPEAGEEAESGASVQEVSAYREAHASYRSGEYDSCIDRFRRFLQTYPTSPYADDAAYWMAECHFKKGDYKSAVLRFDDVVARYPEGDKSADALYRQGEALLKLGPNYAKAASKAFERVIGEYPSSPRAAEAKKQLELLGAHG
jgi:tol-pal system protein YbgF